ncbi:aspartate--tRNA(Asn) ligase [Patescibacteria group bacterium]|nr:aspartate--tRNA(Asn) ligase [Patescibacteria group bacterium]MBU1123741.1 aspartate--tRNA(Asn) ligase [Patescibacteria group bacterium]MBU1911891.1 aspartate--tRNA(Asn) ligase [Patescibacteria group bacterium]
MTESNFQAIGDKRFRNIPETEDLIKQVGERVDAEGAVHVIRNLKNVAFIIIRTFRDKFQVVLDGENLKMLDQIQEGDFVRVRGNVVESRAAYKGVEVRAEEVERLSGPKEQLPIKLGSKKLDMNLNTKLDERVLTLRHLNERAIFKLQEGVVRAFLEYLQGNGFTEIHSPKLVEAGAEGGANIFSLDYFGRKAFLGQSPQFYKQFMVPVFGRVCEVGPAFRAEKHNTSRHINEYTSLDYEMGYIDSFRDIMSMEVGFLKHMIKMLKVHYAHELELLNVSLPEIDQIPCMRFDEAKRTISQHFGREIKDEHDIEPEEERLMSQYAAEEFGSEFLFVTNYPWKKRPFYTMRSPGDEDYTESFDLLFRGIEVTTGGQRIHDYDKQVQAMRDKGLEPDDFGEYLKLHKHGTPPHGGLGIGSERLLMKILNRQNIRESTLFPRDTSRLTP